MGALDNIRRFLLPGDYQNAATEEMHQADKFSPGVPIRPADGYSRVPRAHDFLTGYNIAVRPRRNERVSFSTLQGLVDAYDIAQMAITHRIDSIRSLDWYLEAEPGHDGDIEQMVAYVTKILARPDRELPFRAWLSKFLWDTLAYDAGTLYRMRNNAGRAIGLKVVDGTTIAPLIDYHGGRPTGDAPSYVQFAQGVPWNWLTNDDIIYVPFRPMPNSPYGRSPIESILLNANTDLRFQNYFLSRFTEGTVPEGFATAPESWGPDQIADFQDAWEAMMYGDESKKHQIRWVPGGTNFTWSQENPFQSEFSLFLMRKTAAAFHVTPNDLGFTDTVNLANGETQTDVQFRIGDLPMIQHVQDILTSFIQEDLGVPLLFRFNTGGEKEDRLMAAQVAQIYINSGVISASEVRQETFGLQEPDGVVVPRFIASGQGPIPLANLIAIAGKVDTESAIPDASTLLPDSFTPAEGVLAPADPNMVKEATAGITSATGAVGNPMLSADTEDDDNTNTQTADETVTDDSTETDEGKSALTKAQQAEISTYRKFVRQRKREGEWRDFVFKTLDPDTANKFNYEGRKTVKDASKVIVSMLVMRAQDTGRVLMVQRALDRKDDSAGKLDFPGGHVERGETTFDAAVREWQEEVGVTLPAGHVHYGWKSDNTEDEHVAFIYDVPTEDGVIPRAERVSSIIDPPDPGDPDGPDQKYPESILWVNPKDLQGNPMLKHELRVNIDRVTRALGDAFSHGKRLA